MYNVLMNNGEHLTAEALAKRARLTQLADNEDYRIEVFDDIKMSFDLGHISKSQRESLYSILFAHVRTVRRG